MYSRCKVCLRYAFLPVCLFNFGPVALAQDASAGDWDEMNGVVDSVFASMVGLMQVVMGIGALFTLTMIILKVMRGDKESAYKMFWWTIGLSAGFAMMSGLKAIF